MQAYTTVVVKLWTHPTPNIVSLSYCSEKGEGKKTGRYVLHAEKLPAEEISEPDMSTSTAQGFHQRRQKIGGVVSSPDPWE